MKRYAKYLLIAPPLLICTAAVCLCRSSSGDAQQEIPAASEEQRAQYLAMQGLHAKVLYAEPVVIPWEFGGCYAEYAALQEFQQLPLAGYAGRSASCITYEVTDSDPLLYAELLTADGILIGAQCYHPEDGQVLTIQGEPFSMSSSTVQRDIT